MYLQVLTLFPDLFRSFLEESLIRRAIEKGIFNIDLLNIRDFCPPPHYRTDDTPYGGGPGMVLKAEPIVLAIESAKVKAPSARTLYLSPGGPVLTQKRVRELAEMKELILLCGRYEGVDQRALDIAVDEELSLGDFILMGGEVAAMVVVEAVTRLLPGVLGNEASSQSESFSEHCEGLLLEAPQYTKPAEFRGINVPNVLLSGDHKKISEWRHEESLKKTLRVRPDLLKRT